MLVNQALAVRVFAYARATEALRDAECRLHELIAHQVAAREAERKRLARELEDSLAQNLLAIRLDVAALHQGTALHNPALRKRVGLALDNLDLTLRSVKHLLGELQPVGIELGLQAAVEIEVRKFKRLTGIDCDLDGSVQDEPALAEATVLTVCRVLQESLNNVSRHSLASRVAVSLGRTRDRIAMEVADNGIGFDVEAPRPVGCQGLFALQERVRAAGGTLEVHSIPTQGTTIRLSLSLANPIGPAIV